MNRNRFYSTVQYVEQSKLDTVSENENEKVATFKELRGTYT